MKNFISKIFSKSPQYPDYPCESDPFFTPKTPELGVNTLDLIDCYNTQGHTRPVKIRREDLSDFTHAGFPEFSTVVSFQNPRIDLCTGRDAQGAMSGPWKVAIYYPENVEPGVGAEPETEPTTGVKEQEVLEENPVGKLLLSVPFMKPPASRPFGVVDLWARFRNMDPDKPALVRRRDLTEECYKVLRKGLVTEMRENAVVIQICHIAGAQWYRVPEVAVYFSAVEFAMEFNQVARNESPSVAYDDHAYWREQDAEKVAEAGVQMVEQWRSPESPALMPWRPPALREPSRCPARFAGEVRSGGERFSVEQLDEVGLVGADLLLVDHANASIARAEQAEQQLALVESHLVRIQKVNRATRVVLYLGLGAAAFEGIAFLHWIFHLFF